jgi:CRP/FNR family transcriptional regulator, cyclic AMP receptor protein
MAKREEIVGFLQRVPLFHGLTRRQLDTLAKTFVDRSYKAGQPIVSQGKGGEGFFVITSGAAEAVRERLDGVKVVVNTFGHGDFFGELALLDDGVRTATVTATENVECLVLTSWDFLSILREDADMSVTILKELARRFRAALEVL